MGSLAAFSVSGGQILEEAAVGLHAVGHAEGVSVGDQWHLSSIAKSMTATLAAVLVEESTVAWRTRVSDVFPDLAPGAAHGAVLREAAPGDTGHGVPLGWGVAERSWAGGGVLQHQGSNGYWRASVWLAPARDPGFFAVTNAGGDPAFAATDEAVERPHPPPRAL